jgi:hypothetical protein
VTDASAEPQAAPDVRPGSSRAALWVLAAFGLTLAAAVAAPHFPLDIRAATVATFAGGMIVGLGPLVASARAETSVRIAGAIAVASVVAMTATAIIGARGAFVAAIVNTALVGLAHAAGGSVGRRVEHPGHLLPACVVAAAADFVSVVHPSGPTHAIAESERALSVLAIAFPVAGTHALAPVLGVGDLLFIALVFGVVHRHRLPRGRAALLAAAGVALAGAISAVIERSVPALIPVGAAFCVGLPDARKLRREDRRTARLAIALAAAIATGVLLQRIIV